MGERLPQDLFRINEHSPCRFVDKLLVALGEEVRAQVLSDFTAFMGGKMSASEFVEEIRGKYKFREDLIDSLLQFVSLVKDKSKVKRLEEALYPPKEEEEVKKEEAVLVDEEIKKKKSMRRKFKKLLCLDTTAHGITLSTNSNLILDLLLNEDVPYFNILAKEVVFSRSDPSLISYIAKSVIKEHRIFSELLRDQFLKSNHFCIPRFTAEKEMTAFHERNLKLYALVFDTDKSLCWDWIDAVPVNHTCISVFVEACGRSLYLDDPKRFLETLGTKGFSFDEKLLSEPLPIPPYAHDGEEETQECEEDMKKVKKLKARNYRHRRNNEANDDDEA